MQVTHVADHVTHAVITGKKTIDMGISDSPEFFNILSSTLYSDQILAVVREVLCNAWDAHIDANCTDRPVKVTISGEKFIVQDFGYGIHHDQIGPIYGVYGNSTKKNDGTKTGGFGLGCKAPFAYNDHFEVTSAHEGTKTIYSMSKSSAEVMGKPGIVPIASFPSKETGMTVSVDLQPGDRQRFMMLVRRIAKNGEMNVTLNGEPCETTAYSKLEHNFLITNDDDILGSSNHRIMVRYGNVIYPVDVTRDIERLYHQVIEKLDKMRARGYGISPYKIVLLAQPHTISVTPSRETLSMQAHTIKTINGLFQDFLNMFDEKFDKICHDLSVNLVEKAATLKDVPALISREYSLPYINRSQADLKQMSRIDQMAEHYMKYHYPAGVEFRKKDLRTRFELMIKEGILNRGLIQTYAASLDEIGSHWDRHSHWDRQRETHLWLHKRVIAPLVVKMGNAELMDPKRLYVFDTRSSYWNSNYRSPSKMIPVKELPASHLFNDILFLRNIIVLSYGKNDAFERLRRSRKLETEKLGDDDGFLYYQVSRQGGAYQAAIDFFTARGMTVIDLCAKLDYEIKEEQEQQKLGVVSEPRKPRKFGLPKINSILTTSKKGVNIEQYLLDDAVRITEPEFVVVVPIRQNQPKDRIPGYDSGQTKAIIHLFGDKGAIARNSTQRDQYITKGAKGIEEYVKEKTMAYLTGNQRVLDFMAYDVERVKEKFFDGWDKASNRQILEIIYKNSMFSSKYKIHNPLTQEDIWYLKLFKHIAEYARYRSGEKDILTLQKKFNDVPLDPINQKIAEMIQQRKPFIGMIDVEEIRMTLFSKDSDQARIDSALKILSIALEG